MLRRLSRVPIALLSWLERLGMRVVRLSLAAAAIALVVIALDALLLDDDVHAE